MIWFTSNSISIAAVNDKADYVGETLKLSRLYNYPMMTFCVLHLLHPPLYLLMRNPSLLVRKLLKDYCLPVSVDQVLLRVLFSFVSLGGVLVSRALLTRRGEESHGGRPVPHPHHPRQILEQT